MNTAHPHRRSRRAWFALGFVIAGLALSAIVAVATTAADNDAGVARTGRPAAVQPAAVAPTTGPAIDQQRTSDTSVPAAQAAFEHSRAVSEDPPPTF